MFARTGNFGAFRDFVSFLGFQLRFLGNFAAFWWFWVNLGFGIVIWGLYWVLGFRCASSFYDFGF